MADQPGAQALLDLWKKQMEEGMQAWTRMMGQSTAPDPAQFWRPVMDPGIATWARLMTQGPVSPELMAQWKQFLDQWIAAWGKALEQAMGTEAFAQALGRHLEQWLAIQAPAKKAASEFTETIPAALGLPSRADLARIGTRIADLEDHLERVGDQLVVVVTRLNELINATAGR